MPKPKGTKFERGNIMNHPIDIAYSLNLLAKNTSVQYPESMEDDLQEALYQLKAMAENKYNCECWRTLYKALSAIADIPELSALPF